MHTHTLICLQQTLGRGVDGVAGVLGQPRVGLALAMPIAHATILCHRVMPHPLVLALVPPASPRLRLALTPHGYSP